MISLPKKTLIKVILKNGYSLNGSFQEANNEELIIILLNEDTAIIKISEIACYTYRKVQENFVKDKEEQPQSQDMHLKAQSLVKLRQMKAEEEAKEIKDKINKPKPTAEQIEYEYQPSFVQRLKKPPVKQNK